MSNETPETIYNNRIETIDADTARLKTRDTVWAVLKVLLFIAGFVLMVIFFPTKPDLAMLLFFGFFTLFVAAAFSHEGVLKNIRRLKTLKTINQHELDIADHRFSNDIDTGEEFRDGSHHYTSDLDVFGEKSLFHYINRTVTSIGRKRLAGWLRKPAATIKINQRQQAVNELAEKLTLRQNLRAHGMSIDDTSQKLETLYQLFDEDFFLLPRKGLIVFFHVMTVVTLGLFVSVGWGMPLLIPLGMVMVQLAVNFATAKPVAHIYSLTSRNFKILKAYSGIIADIETETFETPRLKELQHKLERQGQKASRSIRRVATVLEWFDIKGGGTMHFFVNNILFWDLHCVYRIEKWRKETAPVIHDWFDVIGEFEALNSMANLCFNNPSWVFPEIVEKEFRLKATAAGHLLIPPKERVCNDINFEGGSIVITGPNMAGKSTFLRTVGVNAILALAGGPVCAESLEISPFRLVTSMQTSDSLDKHLSLFYAELQRLKMILDAIEGDEPVFFMIDEMLKGTNALDRQKGSIVLVRQLSRLKANGIVATHDLELTKLETEDAKIKNYHFDGYVEGDKLLFDYLLKPGICESFNALVLMKKIGIEL